MVFIAYIILAFAVLQLVVALSNLLFRPDLSLYGSKFTELVSVLIPARNEEKNIGNLLSDLLNQDYKNIEIIIFNDQSTDGTAKIVSSYMAIDNRVKLIHSIGLPEGWLGKNYACYMLSKQAKGNYMLFLDADVRVGNGIILNTINYSIKNNLGLLSIFPKQLMNSIGERVTVPIMNYILLSLLPLFLVRKSKYASLAAANGQFMLFKSKVYNDFNPHEIMKVQKVEDIEIARYFKNNKVLVACLTGTDAIACKMYDGYNDAVNGFAKNMISFFGYSFLAALVFWLITTLGFIAVYLGLGSILLLLYLLTIILTRIFVSIVSKQNAFLNFILLIPQQLIMGFVIYKATSNTLKKQHEWKGRNIL